VFSHARTAGCQLERLVGLLLFRTCTDAMEFERSAGVLSRMDL
jgi:hypothetical protein